MQVASVTLVPAVTQLPLSHVKPWAQSVLAAHVGLHWVPSAVHTRLLHEREAPTTHSPLPLQLLSVWAPELHTEPQTVVAPG